MGGRKVWNASRALQLKMKTELFMPASYRIVTFARHIEVGSSFFFRYSDLFFDVETGPAPAFVFTLSLTFDYKDRIYFPVMDCLPRWQMTAKEYAVVQNHTKGNEMGMYSCNVIFHVLRQIILILTV